MLKNDFFSIVNLINNEGGLIYRISLHATHPIYQAHFPGNPTTPGACIVQLVKELASDCYKKTFFTRSTKNVKFLQVLNPIEHEQISVSMACKTDENGYYHISAVLKEGDVVFSKLILLLEERKEGREPELQQRMEKLGACVIIPTYNNEKTLEAVIRDVQKYTNSILVVNDGSTDSTAEILTRFAPLLEIVSYEKNQGKGHALKQGFDRAEELGYRSAITIDSDGQHLAKDLIAFVDVAEKHPQKILTGKRIIEGQMPSKNSFANQFSNFWFTVQTGRNLQDTQNGFRLYPLSRMQGLRPLSSRYEAELELLVHSAWKGIAIEPVSVCVYYPPKEERVTHFRPTTDFIRISLLNTLLFFLAIAYGYPSMLFHKLFSQKNKG